MMYTMSVLVLLVLGVIGLANGQSHCIPRPVGAMEISSNATLSWEVAIDICAVDHYIVNVQYNFGQIEETIISRVSRVDVSHLPPCEYWVFTVTPVSINLVSGENRHMFGQVPMRPDTDLSLGITSIRQEEEFLVVEWNITNTVNYRCIDSYRLTVVNRITDEVENRLVLNRVAFLRDLSPCGRYGFGVRAIHAAIPESEGPQAYAEYEEPARAPQAPRLESITHGGTYFYSTWHLEERNLCGWLQAHVDGSPRFNITVPISNRQRVSVNVTSLQPSSMYLINVYVDNIAGRSPRVPLAVQTMPNLVAKETN